MSQRNNWKKKFLLVYMISSLMPFRLNLTKNGAYLRIFLRKQKKVMFAKRLAAIFMLVEGASLYHIQTTLNISASIAACFSHNIHRGSYKHIEVFLEQNKRKKIFGIRSRFLRVPGCFLLERGGGSGCTKWTINTNNKQLKPCDISQGLASTFKIKII